MTIKKYKNYTIEIVGLSHYIFHPQTNLIDTQHSYAPGYAQSFAEAKRWINEDTRRVK